MCMSSVNYALEIYLCDLHNLVQAGHPPVARSAEGTEGSSSAEEQANASASDSAPVRGGRRAIRLRSTAARRRSLSRDAERRMRPRSRLPAGRASSLTRTPERSLARRRLARRSCISSVVAARADVRRIRQRRLAPSADPLAKTEEAAEAKLVKKHMAELARARLESKPKFVESASTRCASQSRPSVQCMHVVYIGCGAMEA